MLIENSHKIINEYGSEFDWESNKNFLKSPSTWDYFKGASLYRSGRDALKEIALYHRETHGYILMPALCCESMVSPFVENGYKVTFYRLNGDLSANEEDINSKICDNTIVLYMRYFGLPSLSESFVVQTREIYSNALWVEDRTHDVIIRERKEDFSADETVASIRKWFAIGDGGLSWNSRKVSVCKSDDRFSTIREEAMKMKSLYLATGNKDLKSEFREKLSRANKLLDLDFIPYEMTPASEKLLMELDISKLYNSRKSNVLCLKENLMDLILGGNIELITENPELSTLYFPIIVKHRNELQKYLAEREVYCPVIWPIPEKALGICENAEYISEHMLAIPCDQRYKPQDMKKISTLIHSYFVEATYGG